MNIKSPEAFECIFLNPLFFNVNLNCYIVVELKTKEYNPKDIGQLEFYVGYVENTRKIISTLSNIQQIRIFVQTQVIVDVVAGTGRIRDVTSMVYRVEINI